METRTYKKVRRVRKIYAFSEEEIARREQYIETLLQENSDLRSYAQTLEKKLEKFLEIKRLISELYEN